MRARSRWRWILILAALGPIPGWAQFHAMPYADTSYQFNSNIFAIPSKSPEGVYSDHILEERAGALALYDWSLQQIYANAEWRHFDYDRLGNLSHDEYLVHGGLKWIVGTLFDGIVDYRRERSQVQYLNFTVTAQNLAQLYLQLQDIGAASVNLQITPEWRLQSLGEINILHSPRPGLPDLSLTEDTLHEGLRFVGISRLSAGIDYIYLNGHYNGEEFFISPRYNQGTLEGTAHYVATGVSSLDAALGYTRRNQQIAGTVEGTTGQLSLTRNVSAKTSFHIDASRALNSYVTFGGAELDTILGAGATWNASPKLAVTPAYQWIASSFPDSQLLDALSGLGFIERSDHYQLATLSIKYQLLDWLSLRPYGQYDTRHSNIGQIDFNRSMYGVEFEVRLAREADQPYVPNPTY